MTSTQKKMLRYVTIRYGRSGKPALHVHWDLMSPCISTAYKKLFMFPSNKTRFSEHVIKLIAVLPVKPAVAHWLHFSS
jgi:hypothetical protein